MTREELYEVLADVDEECVQEALTTGVKTHPQRRWVALAACFCAAVVGVLAFGSRGKETPAQPGIVPSGPMTIEEIDAAETYPDFPGTLAVIYTDLGELAADADAIVRIAVEEVSTQPLDGFPRTHTFVTVQEVYKGTLEAGERVEVVEEGGGSGKVLGGIPCLNDEQEYVLFLTAYEDYYFICGAFQGRFILREGYAFQQATDGVKLNTYTPMPVADFAAEIQRLLQGE